jgi:GNAT superfamily N-acetyltransferase
MTTPLSTARPPAADVRYSDRLADLDLATVHGWLTATYWSPGISRAHVEQGFANSRLVMGAFVAGRQVGVARALTDTTRFGYVLDVFVDEAFRGRGIASALVRLLVEHRDATAVTSWLLATRDAHAVYRPLGFTPLADPGRWMARVRRTPASTGMAQEPTV